MKTSSILRTLCAAGLTAILTAPGVAGAQVWNFDTESYGPYAGDQTTILAGGVNARFSGIGLNMRSLGGFPAGAEKVLSSDGDSEVITMELLGGVTTNGITFRNWISGIYTSEVDDITMNAYDGLGTLIGTVTGSTEFLSISADGIAKVTWDDVVQGRGYVLDEITLGRTVSTVPEPGTYLMTAAGMLGLAVFSRRRRKV